MWFKIKKNKDSASTTSNNDNSQPIDRGNDRTKVVEDVEAKSERNRKIIRWVVGLAIIGLLITAFYFACFAPGSKRVSATSVEKNGDNMFKVVDKYDKKEYNVNFDNGGYAYYYVVADSKTDYTVYAKSNESGTINFKVSEFRYDSDPNSENDYWAYIVGDTYIWDPRDTTHSGQHDLNDPKTYSWFHDSIEVHGTVPPQNINFWSVLLELLPTILLVGIMLWSMNRLTKIQGGGAEGGESIFGIGKSQAKIAQSTVMFSDVAGIEEEKEELIEIVDYLKNPEKYAAMGARTPRGVILYGPPGTGKTLLAKAVAGEAKVPFFSVSGSAFEDMLVGVGAKRVRDLFNKAKKAAPSIIFIDELDSVASKRGKFDMAGGGSGLADQTINQLLAEMDGFSTKTGVVVMAATNRLDVLDEAILRPGRFDRHIQVNLPDIKEREAILRIHSKNKNLSAKVHLEDIARRTPGFSGAQLENVLNEATLLAVRFGKSAIGMEEIDEAIDRVIAGPAKRTRVITEAEKKQIAYHEAGHALVGLHTPGSDVVEKITIIPRGQAAGYTLSTPEKQEIHIQKKSDLLSIITAILGGRASEEIIYGPSEISTGAANDLYKVTNIVRSMVMQLGMTSVGMTQYVPSEGQINPYAAKLYSEDTAKKLDAEIEKIIKTQYTKAKEIVRANIKELELIVESLLLLETIVKPQIDYIHKEMKLPHEAWEKKNQLANQKKDESKQDSKEKQESKN